MGKIDTDALDPAIEPEAEKFHRLARVTLGAIPVAGAPLVEVFNSVLESPLNKRKTEAMVQIGEVINDLLDKGIVTIDGLQENDAFISTVSEVCSITLRNHEEEKLKALRNAVKNSALPTCPPDDYRQLFLNFVDVCTPTHIKLLKLFYNPIKWFADHNITIPNWSMGGLTSVIDLGIPELKGHDEIRSAIWKDLYQRGLVSTDSLATTMSRDGMLAGRTTQLGSKLIDFLS